MRLALLVVVVAAGAACGNDTEPLPGNVAQCASSVPADAVIAIPALRGDDPLFSSASRTHWILTVAAPVPTGKQAMAGNCTMTHKGDAKGNQPSAFLGDDPTLLVSSTARAYDWALSPLPSTPGGGDDEWLCRWDFSDPRWSAATSFPEAAKAYYSANAIATVCYIERDNVK